MEPKRHPRLPVSSGPRLSDKVRSVIASMAKPAEIDWIRTGIHALDLMLGDGVPLGRIIEVFGDESTGKSLLGWEIAKAFQQAGGVVVVFDTEATTPVSFIKRVGVKVEELIYKKPETIEELEKTFFEVSQNLRKADPKVKILWLHDSVAATCSEGEWEIDKKTKMRVPKEVEMAARARAMSRLMRHISLEVSRSNSVYLAINQLRDKIGVMFGETTTTPGGRGLKFHASIRLQLSRGKRVDGEGAQPVGIMCNAFVKKNKCSEPFRKAPLVIKWKQGFDRVGGLIELLEAQGRIQPVPGKSGLYKLDKVQFKIKDLDEMVERHPELISGML